jgi:polysaccharide pyruvyl transferase WcaK-like protein
VIPFVKGVNARCRPMARSTSQLDSAPGSRVPRTAPSKDYSSVVHWRDGIIARRRTKPISPLRIGLFGLFGCGNSGNDGSLEAMILFLHQVRPGAKLACICLTPERVARVFNVTTIPFGGPEPTSGLLRRLDKLLARAPHKLSSFVHAIGHMRNLDILIVPGTGILDDFGEGPAGIPLVLFVWCLAARLCGTRIALVSIGAGPIHHPVSRWLMKSAARMAEYRSYRDTVSKGFMHDIGFDARKDAVYPDIAFKLPVPASAPRYVRGRPLTVGVGVMTYVGWHNDAARGARTYSTYLEKIARFILWLLDHDHPVRILMGDLADQRAVDDLLTHIRTVRPELPKARLAFDPISSLHDLMRQIAETDVVVATRYHNIVCSLKMGKPTVSIGYAEKNDVLMAAMGLHGFCQHIERLDVDLLIERFNRLIADRQRYEQDIDRVNRAFQECLGHQDALLAARVLSG